MQQIAFLKFIIFNSWLDKREKVVGTDAIGETRGMIGNEAGNGQERGMNAEGERTSYTLGGRAAVTEVGAAG